MQLVLDFLSAGYDAIDKQNKKVQIKTRRINLNSSNSQKGRIGSFEQNLVS
jgi:hypothetical protein